MKSVLAGGLWKYYIRDLENLRFMLSLIRHLSQNYLSGLTRDFLMGGHQRHHCDLISLKKSLLMQQFLQQFGRI